MKTVTTMVIVPTIVALAIGCAPAAVRQPDWAGPSDRNRQRMPSHTMDACERNGHARPQAAALAAVLMTMEQTDWTIVEPQIDRATILAKACLRDNPSNCVTKKFFADAYGLLIVSGSARPDLEDDVIRWFVVFEREYNRFCAYSDDILDEELAKYWK